VALHFSSQIAEEEVEKKEEILDIHFYTSLNVKKKSYLYQFKVDRDVPETSNRPKPNKNLQKLTFPC